jgi:hypothetical protein
MESCAAAVSRRSIAGVLEVLREQGRRPEPNIQILDVAV